MLLVYIYKWIIILLGCVKLLRKIGRSLTRFEHKSAYVTRACNTMFLLYYMVEEECYRLARRNGDARAPFLTLSFPLPRLTLTGLLEGIEHNLFPLASRLLSLLVSFEITSCMSSAESTYRNFLPPPLLSHFFYLKINLPLAQNVAEIVFFLGR